MMKSLVSLFLFSFFILHFSFPTSACMTFVVGKKLSATGRVIVGHNEDDWPPFETHHGLLPERDWPAGSVLPATSGCNAKIPQAAHTLAAYWSEVKFTYGDGNADIFLNAKGVFITSDSGGNSRERMDDPTLLIEGGVKFNLRRMVGERATSARDGVRILCEAVEKYGYAPSARIYTVADRDEAYLVQVVHGRHYVAVRCPDDEVTIMPNLYTVYELDAWPQDQIKVSPGLLENARRKGFWDGQSKFNFAKAYQGSYDYGEAHAFEHPNNTGRFRQAIRLLTGTDWPQGKPFPFSVKPNRARFSVADLKAILSAHNGSLKDGRHQLQSWSICSSTTIESTICVFADAVQDHRLEVACGRPCETKFHSFRPFREGLPAALDESATAPLRLSQHVQRMTRMPYFSPAPGRTSGCVYYFVPDTIDYAKPAPLLVFLHGGDARSPDSAPENYFAENALAMPAFKSAPFIVVAPSAPPARDGSRWNREGTSQLILATIEDARNRFNIDPERIFLGGHSMGGFGAYHLGQILADRLAGVWCSAGAWWEADFRAFLGTPVYLQHGSFDCSLRPDCALATGQPRKQHWCGVAFARAAHELMSREGVEHVYDEYAGGHSLKGAEAQAATLRFFRWAQRQRRDPYARKCAVMTLCGSAHPDVEPMRRSRWLEILETTPGDIEVPRIVLQGPDVIRSDAELSAQTYAFTSAYRDDAARIVAENLGDNRFKIAAENVSSFRILLSESMGDLRRPFALEFVDGRQLTLSASPLVGDHAYTAQLLVK